MHSNSGNIAFSVVFFRFIRAASFAASFVLILVPTPTIPILFDTDQIEHCLNQTPDEKEERSEKQGSEEGEEESKIKDLFKRIENCVGLPTTLCLSAIPYEELHWSECMEVITPPPEYSL